MGFDYWPQVIGLALGIALAFTPLGAFGFALGYTIGSMVGSMLFPPDPTVSEGPRLEDLSVQTSEYGAPLAVVWGRMRVAGNVAWCQGNRLIEERVKHDKGDVEYITYNYYASIMVEVCWNPDGVPIDGITKIWANNKLIYDSATTTYSDADLETIYGSLPTWWLEARKYIRGDKRPGVNFRVYVGDDTYKVDPLMEADLGVGNVPGLKKIARVVFEKLPLKDYGNGIPNIEFEVARKTGDSYPNTVDIDPAASSYRSAVVDEQTDLVWSLVTRDGEIHVTDPWTETTVAKIELGLNDGIAHEAECIDINYIDRTAVVLCRPEYDTTGAVPSVITIDLTTYQVLGITYAYDEQYSNIYTGTCFYHRASGLAYKINTHTVLCTIQVFEAHFSHTPVVSLGEEYSNHIQCDRWEDWEGNFHTYPVWHPLAYMQPNGIPQPYDGRSIFVIGTNFGTKSLWILAGVSSTVLKRVYRDNFAGWGDNSQPHYVFGYDHRRHRLLVGDISETTSQHVLAIFDLKDDVIQDPTFVDMGSFVRGMIYNYDADEWIFTNGSSYHIHRGDDFSLVESRSATGAGTDGGFIFPTSTNWFLQGYQYKVYHDTVPGATGPQLGTVLKDLLLMSSYLQESDLDLTAIPSALRVRGYAATRVAAIRANIEPLRKAFLFDIIELDHKLVVKMRGGSVTRRIDWDDLGVHDESEEDPPVAYSVSRRMEVDMPRELTVKYQDQTFDYQYGIGRAVHLATGSDKNVTVSLPIVFHPNEGAQLAEVLLRQDWISRTTYSFYLGPKHSDLAPGDIVEIPRDENETEFFTVLINQIDMTPSGVLKVGGVREHVEVYTSYAVNNTTSKPPALIEIIRPATLFLLDIPYLGIGSVAPGFYFGIGKTSGYFQSGRLLRSDTSDGTYLLWGSAQYSATGGYCETALGTADPTVPDYSSTIRVTLTDLTAALQSATFEEVLAGANMAVAGSEVIHFMTATLVSGRAATYDLSGFLRGRCGTEWAIDSHAAGEKFVLLNAAIVGANDDVADLGTPFYYKGIAAGQDPDTARAASFTNTFAALKPYAPCNLVWNGATNTLTWVRRDRMNGWLQFYQSVTCSEDTVEYEVDVLEDDVVQTTYTGITTGSKVIDISGYTGVVSFKVYQISAQVDRGYAATLEI